MDDNLFYKMLEELKSNGCYLDTANVKKMVFTKSDNDILIKYIGKYKSENYNKLVIRCLSQPKMYYLSSVLINEFINTKDVNSDYKWVIGNALYTINNKEDIEQYIDIIQDSRHGKARQMIVLLVGKNKCNCAIDPLLDLLKMPDYDVILHVICALSHFSSEKVFLEIQRFMMDLVSEKGMGKFVCDMNYLKANNPEYEHVDIQGFWKSIQKESNKILSRKNSEIMVKLKY